MFDFVNIYSDAIVTWVTLDCNGGSSAAVTARIRKAWMKWRELEPVLLGPVTPFI